MGERFIAMLALERPAHVTAKQVVEQVGKRFPDNRIPVSNAAQGYKPGVPVMQLRVETLEKPRARAAGRGGR